MALIRSPKNDNIFSQQESSPNRSPLMQCNPAKRNVHDFAPPTCRINNLHIINNIHHDRSVMPNDNVACDHTCRRKQTCGHQSRQRGVSRKRVANTRKASGLGASLSQVNVHPDTRLKLSVPESVCMAGIGLSVFMAIVLWCFG